LSKGCASVYQRSVWDASLRLYVENTYNYFGAGIKMDIKSPAGGMPMPFWCSIMIQLVYECVHLCYKHCYNEIEVDTFRAALGGSSGLPGFKYDMISAI